MMFFYYFNQLKEWLWGNPIEYVLLHKPKTFYQYFCKKTDNETLYNNDSIYYQEYDKLLQI